MAQPAPPFPPISFSTEPVAPPFLEQVRRLLTGDSEMLRHMADAAGGLAVNLAVAVAILALTVWASGVLSRMACRALARAHRGAGGDTTLQSFTASLVRYSVVAVGLVGVLQQLGVKATSVIAVLGAASLAIGLALQGALSNVAAGVMILILRPYRIGDRVEINGKFGVVKGLDLFSTRIADLDNLSVFVPNGKAFGEIIVNYTATDSHRVQLDFIIDFADDVDRAFEVMTKTAAADPRVLAHPPPWARLRGLEERGQKVTLRAWMKPADWYNGRFDLLKAVKDALQAEGFSFPYPHQVAVTSRPFRPPQGRAAPEARSFAPKADGRDGASQTL